MGANAYTSKIRFTNGASNTGYYTNFGYNSDGNKAYLQIADGATAATIMTWNYNGNVGIGTSSPTGILELSKVNSGGVGPILFLRNNAATATGNATQISFAGNSGGDATTPTAKIVATEASNAASTMTFFTYDGTTVAERMRITSGGSVLMGATSTFGSCFVGIAADLSPYNGVVIKNTNASLYGSYMAFYNASNVTAGYISQATSTTVLYVTSSDYRLKNNIKPIKNAIDRVLKIKPVTYNWKDTNDEVGEGFIAHELQEIVPLAVSGEKDAINEDGTIKAQGIDYAKLTPILVAAIQEQQIQIQNLQEQINILAK